MCNANIKIRINNSGHKVRKVREAKGNGGNMRQRGLTIGRQADRVW